MSAYTSPDSFTVENPGAERWEDRFKADAETMRHRGFASDFVGAWLALWACVAAEYGAHLEAESERMRARKGLPGESREVILEKARRAALALVGAACRADKRRPLLRSFKAPAWALECAARGTSYDFDAMQPGDAQRVKANLSRYWREAWSYVFLVQRVTHFPFFERVRKRFLEAAEDATTLAETGRLTPEQAAELLAPLLPLSRLAQSAYADGVTTEDSAPEPEPPPVELARTNFSGGCEKPGQNEGSPEIYADNFIRIDDPAAVTLDDFLAPFFPDLYEDINLRAFGPKVKAGSRPRRG